MFFFKDGDVNLFSLGKPFLENIFERWSIGLAVKVIYPNIQSVNDHNSILRVYSGLKIDVYRRVMISSHSIQLYRSGDRMRRGKSREKRGSRECEDQMPWL